MLRQDLLSEEQWLVRALRVGRPGRGDPQAAPSAHLCASGRAWSRSRRGVCRMDRCPSDHRPNSTERSVVRVEAASAAAGVSQQWRQATMDVAVGERGSVALPEESSFTAGRVDEGVAESAVTEADLQRKAHCVELDNQPPAGRGPLVTLQPFRLTSEELHRAPGVLEQRLLD